MSAVPALRVDELLDRGARVDLVTVANGRQPAKVLGACCYAVNEEGEAVPPAADDFGLVEAERNARRLAASWNLLRVVPLERIEQWVEAGQILGDNGQAGQA